MYLYFPIVAAVLYGLGYSLLARGLPQLDLRSFFIVYASIWIPVSLGHAYLTNGNFQIAQAFQVQNWIAVFGSLCCIAATILTYYAVRNVSPTYAAIGEMAYVIFIPIFMYLLFAIKDFNKLTLVGGAIVIVGLSMVVYSQQMQTKTLETGEQDARL